MAFYFAWLIHYTGWLIPPMIVGCIAGLAMISQGADTDKEPEDYLNSPVGFLYGLFMMVWVTVFHESWTRKQN